MNMDWNHGLTLEHTELKCPPTKPRWKPPMLRIKGAIIFLLVILVLIGLLEVAARKLPHHVNSAEERSRNHKAEAVLDNIPAPADIFKRQASTTESKAAVLITSTNSTNITSSEPLPMTSSPSGSEDPDPGLGSDEQDSTAHRATITPTISPLPSSPNNVDSTSPESTHARPIATFPRGSSFTVTSLSGSDLSSGSVNPDGIINSEDEHFGALAMAPPNSIPLVSISPKKHDVPNEATSGTVFTSGSPSNIESVHTLASQETVVMETLPRPLEATQAVVDTFMHQSASQWPSRGPSQAQATILLKQTAMISVPTTSSFLAFSLSGQAPIQTTAIMSAPRSISAETRQTVTKTMTFTAITNQQNPLFNQKLLPSQEPDGPLTVYVITIIWPEWAGFLGSGIIAVLIISIVKLMFTVFHDQLALIDPFTQLAESTDSGAVASNTIFLPYTSHSLLKGPFHEIKSRRWLLSLACVTALLTVFFPALASEVFFTSAHDCDFSPPPWNPESRNPCPRQLMVNMGPLRALQVLLSVVAVVVVLLAILLRRRTSGVYSDPSSLVGIASLLHHPDSLALFRSIPPEASIPQMKTAIGRMRFKLAGYQSEAGTYRYGLIPTSGLDPVADTHTTAASSHRCRSYIWVSRWLHEVVLAALLLGLLGLVIAYYRATDPLNRFNVFFNGDGVGPRFILTMTGSITAILWGELFAKVDLNNTLYQLERGNAKPRRTVLAARNTTSLTAFLPALLRGQLLLSTVAFCDVLFLLVIAALPAVPYNPGQSRLEYLVFSYIVIGIISSLFAVLLIVLAWNRKRVSKWPRPPETVAALMSYFIDSDLLKHFEAAADADQKKERETAESTIEARAWDFKPRTGLDGTVRWTVVEAGSSGPV